MEILRLETPIARKIHICMLCGCEIKPGKKYVRTVIADNNSVYNAIAHRKCNILCSLIGIDDSEWVDSGLFHSRLQDYVTDRYPDDEFESKSDYEWVERILSDWDTRESRILRLKERMYRYQSYPLSLGESMESREKKVEMLGKQIEELEQE